MVMLMIGAVALAHGGSSEEPQQAEKHQSTTAPKRSDKPGKEHDTQLRFARAELATYRAQREEARAELADARRERDEFAATMDRSDPGDRDMLAYLDAGVDAARADVASWAAMVRQQEAMIRMDERGKATSLRFEV
jgi:multidrug resistance efflux pump